MAKSLLWKLSAILLCGMACAYGADDEPPKIELKVTVPSIDATIPLLVPAAEGRVSYKDTTFGICVDSVIVDGKRLIGKIVSVPDMDMTKATDPAPFRLYQLKLSPLYSTINRPPDYEVIFFDVPKDARKVIIFYRQRLQDGYGKPGKAEVEVRR